ncbi:MAG TPA: glycosyltransferase [Candidatus Sumerlaeota bacterium]|nr:MAG: GDP-mannose-dependent alpha-(1-6)-phosphatidylinositol monomannoside mannosyltransferase [candidate division BRC1 bacterium ADurb.Bin183]HOE64333.1 glycosyltransferase [Candidatus Sumerlaeota bacterium]HRR31303.1 glycosyltransferase [Candidatus Sumerlaeia bacterium]HON49638.1 glycosyltransferase [Candidatus Sumerlaeota bacterium]HOR65801.1 glycosyltransferase [Candidatus Sumerlaeota bacterium]
MKSVLHIYKDYFPPVIGGIEKHIHQVAEGTRDEYDVRVLVANTRSKTEVEDVNGITVIKAASLGRIASSPICPTFPKLLKKYAADILHFHCPNPIGDISYLINRPSGKVVVTYHSDVVRQRSAMIIYGALLRRFLRLASVIMPTSPQYIDSSSYLSDCRDKCEPVPLGIETDRFQKTPAIEAQAEDIRKSVGGQPIILFVGRLRYYKGLHFLIQALPMVKESHLFIVGAGPEETPLRRQAKMFRVEDRVTFVGAVEDGKLPLYYYASDIFCLPSHLRSEAYGLVQLEAMTCGLPVVSCNLKTGVPFVNKDGETGIIVEPGSPSALSNALNQLLSDVDLRKKLGSQAQKRALAEFDVSVMIRRIKAVYERVISS